MSRSFVYNYLIFNKIRYLIFVSVFSLFGWGCQTPYTDLALDANEQIPVVNGVISNLDGLQSFELYYAMPYTDKRKIRIAGAQVTVKNGQGQFFEVPEISPGYYSIDKNLVTLETGINYYIEVAFNNGTVLKSEPAPLSDTLSFGAVFHDYNIRSTIVKDVNGNFNQVNENGIFIYTRLKAPTKETCFRTHADYYIHSQYWSHQFSTFEVDCTFYSLQYQIQYDTLYNYLEGVSNTDFPTIGKLNPGWNYSTSELTFNTLFLPADKECRDFTAYTTNTFVQWIFPVELIATSAKTYEYYQKAYEQLNPEDRIFDPIPEQLVGNIYNETETDQPALGLFDVVSVNRKYYSVYVHEAFGYRSYQGRFYNDTVFKSGRYPVQIRVDTTFLDTLFPSGINFYK